MFITRASRHDRADVAGFLGAQGYSGDGVGRGTVFFAREGGVVGSVRLVEVAPQVLVIEDLVVDRQRRRQGIGSRLMQAAMNSRGGALFVRTEPAYSPFFERLGFAEVPAGNVPEAVAAELGGDVPSGGHVVMRARG